MNETRKAKIAELTATIRNEFPEVARVTTVSKGARLIAWSANDCIIGEETSRTLDAAAMNLCIALGYRRERNDEMEAQRVLFAQAVR